MIVRHAPVEYRFFQCGLYLSDCRTGRDVANRHDFIAPHGALKLPQLVLFDDLVNPRPQEVKLLQVTLDFTWFS